MIDGVTINGNEKSRIFKAHGEHERNTKLFSNRKRTLPKHHKSTITLQL